MIVTLNFGVVYSIVHIAHRLFLMPIQFGAYLYRFSLNKGRPWRLPGELFKDNIFDDNYMRIDAMF